MSEKFESKASLNTDNVRIGIVISRFNIEITEALLQGAREAFESKNGDQKQLDCFWVPGAFELPLIAKKLAKTKKYDAILCLGAVVRGGTPHFEYVSLATATGINQVALETEIPVLFGVLTCDNQEQAEARTKGENNKGYQTMLAALEMIALSDHLQEF